MGKYHVITTPHGYAVRCILTGYIEAKCNVQARSTYLQSHEWRKIMKSKVISRTNREKLSAMLTVFAFRDEFLPIKNVYRGKRHATATA